VAGVPRLSYGGLLWLGPCQPGGGSSRGNFKPISLKFRISSHVNLDKEKQHLDLSYNPKYENFGYWGRDKGTANAWSGQLGEQWQQGKGNAQRHVG
jgi:hypothetical protein